jgi:septal ring factor EnvC (AmiA/AmiB activator)
MSTQLILANASHHARLLSSIAEFDYAPSALTQQQQYLADLKYQHEEIQKEVERLAKITKKERKEHESARDSKVMKMAYRIVGKKEKFEVKANKEEKYVFSRLSI